MVRQAHRDPAVDISSGCGVYPERIEGLRDKRGYRKTPNAPFGFLAGPFNTGERLAGSSQFFGKMTGCGDGIPSQSPDHPPVVLILFLLIFLLLIFLAHGKKDDEKHDDPRLLLRTLHQPTDQTLFYVIQKPHKYRHCCL